MFGALDFPLVILELHEELKREHGAGTLPFHDESWRGRVFARAARRIQDPLAFLDWAKRDRHWSYTLAEVLRDSSLRPLDVAARLLVAMLEQIEEEIETTRPDLTAPDLDTAQASPPDARQAV